MRTVERSFFNNIEFTASIAHESRLLTDPYILVWREKGLYSPNHQCYVRSCIEKNSPDIAAYDFLERVVEQAREGTVLWFSPALNSEESHKIIATEIYTARNGAKITYNYAVLFLQSKLKEGQFLQAANKIAEFAKEEPINSALERRMEPIFLPSSFAHWTYFANRVIPNREWEKIHTREVWIIKRETLRAIREGKRNIYGNNPLSCPLSAFDVMFGFGEKVNCKNCKKVVYVKVGERCGGCNQVRPC